RRSGAAALAGLARGSARGVASGRRLATQPGSRRPCLRGGELRCAAERRARHGAVRRPPFQPLSDGRAVVAVVSPYRLEYGPREVLGHAARALAEAGMTPLCIVPEGARRSPDLDRIGAEVRVVEGFGTVPR